MDGGTVRDPVAGVLDELANQHGSLKDGIRDILNMHYRQAKSMSFSDEHILGLLRFTGRQIMTEYLANIGSQYSSSGQFDVGSINQEHFDDMLDILSFNDAVGDATVRSGAETLVSTSTCSVSAAQERELTSACSEFGTVRITSASLFDSSCLLQESLESNMPGVTLTPMTPVPMPTSPTSAAERKSSKSASIDINDYLHCESLVDEIVSLNNDNAPQDQVQVGICGNALQSNATSHNEQHLAVIPPSTLQPAKQQSPSCLTIIVDDQQWKIMSLEHYCKSSEDGSDPILCFKSGEDCMQWLQSRHRWPSYKYRDHMIKHMVVDHDFGEARMSGHELIRRIRDLGKQQRDLAICSITVVSVTIMYDDSQRCATHLDIDKLSKEDIKFFEAGATCITKYDRLVWKKQLDS